MMVSNVSEASLGRVRLNIFGKKKYERYEKNDGVKCIRSLIRKGETESLR